MRIGLVLNILDEEYQISVFKGIKAKARELGIEIVCFQEENERIGLDSFVANVHKKDFFDLDGIILLTSVMAGSNEIIIKSDLEKIWGNIPIVSLGQKIQGIPSVLIDTDKSMEQLVTHLIYDHQYKSFLFLGGTKGHTDGDMREKIFVETIEKYKKEIPELEYTLESGSFIESEALLTLMRFYEKNPGKKLDAIVCANDNMAIGTYKFFEMNKNNKNVIPCAVTGFDDIPQAKYIIPPLTTIQQPLEEIGIESVNKIYQMITQKIQPEDSFVNSKLILRNSCGCNENEPEWKNSPKIAEQIQANYVESEQMLKMVSHIGQNLNYAEEENGLRFLINMNLDALGIKDFAVLNFPNHTPGNIIKGLNSFLVRPVFVKRNGNRVFYENEATKLIHLGQFYKKFLEYDKEKPTSLVFKFLTMGNEAIGCVLYDSPDNILPYLCSITINISQCINRIESFEEKRRRSEYLEKEVEKRTAELVEANNKRMEVEAEVLKISELERQRFSNDLHDDICQRLAGISMLCRSFSNSDIPVEKEQLVELAELIGDTLQTTRQYAHNSYPVELESLGMNKSVANLCNSFEKQSGIKCNYHWDVQTENAFDKIQKLNIFRIIQEALHNIVKHAKAKNVNVLIKADNEGVLVQITDDGCGIKKAPGNDSATGIGMNSMHYRANQIGASFKILAREPSGTCIEVRL